MQNLTGLPPEIRAMFDSMPPEVAMQLLQQGRAERLEEMPAEASSTSGGVDIPVLIDPEYLCIKDRIPSEQLFEYLHTQDQRGEVEGTLGLGFYFLEQGRIETACKMFEKAADRGSFFGCMNISILLYHKNTDAEQLAEDDRKALDYATRALDLEGPGGQRDPVALYWLSICYSKGVGGEESDRKAFELCKESADMGHLDAILDIAKNYFEGNGCEINAKKALEYYIQAGEKGSGNAWYTAGQICESGCGNVDKDLAQAAYFYRKAQLCGDKDARGRMEAIITEIAGDS